MTQRLRPPAVTLRARVFARASAVILVALGLAGGCAPGEEPFDLLVRGGTVIDGSGAAPFEADVGVRDGAVVFVGDARGRDATDVIEAQGLVVAPGFVDAHNHTEWAVLEPERRLNEGFVRQGVTTVVGGADGSVAPGGIRRIVSILEAQGAGTNVALYVGHNAIRDEVLGDDQQRAPTDEELGRMRALVREGMELGALGLSTGLMYEPGMFSQTDEVVALAEEVAPFGGIYDSHVRDPVHHFVESHAEAIEIGERAGIGAKLGHLKSVGLENEGRMREVIARVEAARAAGRVVVSDQYPYDGAATSTLTPLENVSWGILLAPPDLLDGGTLADLDFRTLLRDPATRERIRVASEQGIEGGFAWLKATGYSAMRITHSEDFPELVGRYLSELAEERGVEPFDAVAELVIAADSPVHLTLGAIKEHEVQELLVQPWNMVASDGELLDADSTAGHPRGTGTFPRVLGHYARDLGLLTLEEAVRKMTSLPAGFLGLEGRGRIAEGAVADLVVFDPETIRDRSTWVEPQLFAEGVVDVVVGGVSVLRAGEMTGAAPGAFVPRGSVEARAPGEGGAATSE